MLCYITKLNTLLDDAVLKCVANISHVGIPFSGGLDSSIIASLTCKYTEVTLYVAGFEGAHDLSVAREAAEMLKLPLIEITLVEQDIENALPLITKIIESKNPIEISFELPLFFVSKHAREKILISAQGADELFAGYAKYLNLKIEYLNTELVRAVRELKETGIQKDKQIAAYFGKELRVPFLEPTTVELGLNIPSELKIKNGLRKYILREFGKFLGLPPEITSRAKKGAQYGSGIMKVLKKLAAKENLSLALYLEKI